MKNQLLVEELNADESSVIVESIQDGKNLYLNGIFMQSAIKNRNGRVYPITEMQAAVKSSQMKIKETNGILGELDHPNSLQISLDRVSHVITEMWMNGNNAYGKARILDTQMGSIAKELIKANVKLGVSSRGAGMVNESGEVSGFNLITVDIVATPSAPGAVPNSVYESLMTDRHGVEVLTLAQQVKQDKSAQKYLEKEILKFLSSGLFAKK